MDYFDEMKKITRAAWPTHQDDELFECEWCNAEFESKEMLEKHADVCDRLYLAKW